MGPFAAGETSREGSEAWARGGSAFKLTPVKGASTTKTRKTRKRRRPAIPGHCSPGRATIPFVRNVRLGAGVPSRRRRSCVALEGGTVGLSHVAVAPRSAARAEANGFDGMVIVDSQNLAGDPFVGLALAARE